jgi:hypothetical protein
MAKKKSWVKRLFLVLGFFILGEIVWVFFIYPWASDFGATRAERDKALPGDAFAPNAFSQSTFAITIDAPAEEVWKWLIQIGQDRGGFYSLTFLENLVGAGIHNHLEIRPEWQELKVGDLVRLAPPSKSGKPGPLGDPACQVLAVAPPRFLYLKGWGAFVLEPAADGKSTRFFIRGRNELGPGTRFAMKLFLEPIHFLMQRRMMFGIKETAEAGPEKSAIPSTGDYVWFISLVAAGLLILFLTASRFGLTKLAAAYAAWILVTLGLFRLPPSPIIGAGILIVAVLTLAWMRRAEPR